MTVTDPDQMVDETAAGDTSGQWYQVAVPAIADATMSWLTASPRAHTLHSGKIEVDSSGSPAFGWPGFTLDTAQLIFMNTDLGVVMNSAGDSLQQSTFDQTHLAGANLNMWGANSANLGSSNLVMVASISTGPTATQALESTIGTNRQPPLISTHGDFVTARNGISDAMEKANNWFTFAMTAIVSIKQILGMSTLKPTSFEGIINDINALSALAQITTAGVTAGLNNNQFGTGGGSSDFNIHPSSTPAPATAGGTASTPPSAPASSPSSPPANPWADGTQYYAAGTNQSSAADAWVGGVGSLAGIGKDALEPDEVDVRKKLDEQHDSATAALDKAKKATPRDQAVIDKAQAKVDQIERDQIAADPARMRAEQGTLTQREAAVTSATTKLTTATTARDTAVASRNTEQTKNDALRDRIAAKDREIAAATDDNERTRLTSEKTQLETQKRASDTKLQGLKDDVTAQEAKVTAATKAKDDATTARDAQKTKVEQAKRVATDPSKRQSTQDAQSNLATKQHENEQARTALDDHSATQPPSTASDADKAAWKTEHDRLQGELDKSNKETHEAQVTSNHEEARGAAIGKASKEESSPWAERGSKGMDAGSAGLGAAAAGFGLYSAIEQSNTPSGIGMVSDNPLFFATESSYGAVAMGGFNFCAPNVSGFQVMTGGGFTFQSLLGGQLFSLQSVSIEGGISAEIVAGGEVKVGSRRRAVKVAGATIEMGLQEVDAVLFGSAYNPMGQLPTQTITIQTLQTGTITLQVGEDSTVTISPTSIELSFMGDTVTMAMGGISIKSATKISMDAPVIALTATGKASMQGAQVAISADAQAQIAVGAGNVTLTPGTVAGTSGAGGFKINGPAFSAGSP